MSTSPRPPTGDPRLIWNVLLSPQILPAVAVCDERGIFAALGAGGLSAGEIAARLRLTDEWAEVLLGAAAALQLVRVMDGRFHLTDSARSFLLPESPFYAGAALRRFAARDGAALGRLHRALENTGPNLERYEVREWQPGDLDPAQVEEGLRTLHSLSYPSALAMAASVDPRQIHRVLDIAGGAGSFAIALTLRHPEVRCTVAELPVVCPMTQRFIERYGAADRVNTIPLNMFYEDWPRGYDAVLLSSVLHDWDLPRRMELLRRAFAALPVGGQILIHEQLLSDAADGPFGAALFSLDMRVGTLGKQFTAAELGRALVEAGFADVSVVNTYGYFSLICARKR
jgi:acetylserotonin N-methyltransferase